MATYNSLFPAADDDLAHVDPFQVPDLWRPSVLTPKDLHSSFFSLSSLKDTVRRTDDAPPLPDPAESSLFPLPKEFDLPSRRTFGIWPEPPPEQPPSDAPSASTDGSENVFSSVKEDEAHEDVWLSPGAAAETAKPRFHTWDSFLRPGENDPPNSYLSEAPAGVVDAAIEEWAGGEGEAGAVIRTDVFCTCLLHLGLGRSSVLFMYDRTTNDFKPVRENMRISGCTAGAVESIVATFTEFGKSMKTLQRFSDHIYGSPDSSPTQVALAQCTTDVLEAIQQRLSVSPRALRSPLHLSALIRDPALIADTFAALIGATESSKTETELLSTLFDTVEQLQHRGRWLRPALVETLARAGRPWLEAVEKWVGLDQSLGWTPGGLAFVKVEEQVDVDEDGRGRVAKVYSLAKDQAPSFLTEESMEAVFETGRSLRLLETFHPGHPLANPGKVEGTAPKLEWKFEWTDLDHLQSQAQAYEQRLRSAVAAYATPASTAGNPQPSTDDSTLGDSTLFVTKEAAAASLADSLTAMNSVPTPAPASVSRLTRLVLTSSPRTSAPSFHPPLSVTPQLSFSHLFAVQSRLTNAAVLRLFFHEHPLRQHLALLRAFPLFGSGVFASRLAHALFSDETHSTRRSAAPRTGVAMGLKLGTRDAHTWPPASSELRLALMGVLAESAAGEHHAGARAEAELPGGLSFVVREMGEAELARCLDPAALEALDFLALAYRPPRPLAAVITPAALANYDRVFRLLLRASRMLFVVNSLWTQAARRRRRAAASPESPAHARFRVDATHFVTAVAGYMTESAVGGTWAAFAARLDALARCADDPADPAAADGAGLAHVRALHEATLERMCFALLLRKRQEPVLRLLDEIWTLVLRFARGGGGDAAELHAAFRRRVQVFVAVCRGLSEKRGGARDAPRGDGRRAAESVLGSVGAEGENGMLAMLLVRLETSGYYGKR